MFTNFNIKKLIIILTIIMISSFSLASAIFVFSGGTLQSFIKSSGISKHTINQEKTFSIEGLNEINIQTVDTDIRFIPAETSEIKVLFYGDVFTSNPDAIPFLEQNLEQNKLNVQVKSKPTNFSLGWFSNNLMLNIYVPKSYSKNINSETASGTISINGFKLKNFNHTSISGDINIKSLSTQFANLETASGNSNITDFSGNLKCKSISGDVNLDYNKFDNNTDIDTISGNAKLNLPERSQFFVKVETNSGNINSTFPLLIKGRSDEHSLEGIVESDKNKINITTVSGDVGLIKKR